MKLRAPEDMPRKKDYRSAETDAREKRIERLRKESERAAEREKRRRRRLEAAKIRDEKRAEMEKKRTEKRAARAVFFGKIKGKLKNGAHGFGYRNHGFLPRIEVTVRGDGASVASRLSAEGINTEDLIVASGRTTFKIRKKDKRKAVAIFRDMCYNYSIDAEYGIGRLFAFFAARIGLAVGAVAAVVCLNISYGYVWRIDISGNDKLSAAAIESVLNGADIKVGMRKRSVDTDDVSAVINGMDGVADAAAEIVGTTLRVYVLESKDYAVHGKCTAYESAYDATVTRIVLRDGTALVKRGDVVKRGDMLANGDVFSTAGELLYTAECDAEVYGDVSLTYSAEISATAVEYRRTGRSQSETGFELFGCKFLFPKPPYDSYESAAVTTNYDVFVPLYVTTVHYYETEAVEIERDIEAAAREFAAAKIEETNFTGEFKSSYTVKETVAGLYSIHVFLSGETLISRGTEREYDKPPVN